MNFLTSVLSLFTLSGFSALTTGNMIMLLVGGVLLYLAIVKKFEPLLLLPIGFGAILVNLPLGGLMEEGGLLYYISFGINHEIFPCLIFMGIGAMTDFGPLLANPITLLLGAAAQLGVFVALLGAKILGFTIREAASIAIIGGANWRGGWAHRHLSYRQISSSIIRGSSGSCLFLYVPRPFNSASHYEITDYARREKDSDETT